MTLGHLGLMTPDQWFDLLEKIVDIASPAGAALLSEYLKDRFGPKKDDDSGDESDDAGQDRK